MPHNHHHNSFAATLLATLILASTACSTTDQTTITAPAAETPTPNDTIATPDAMPGETGSTVVTPDAGTTGPVAPVVEPSTPDAPGGENSDDAKTVNIDYPDIWLTNRSDPSTPLGKLCWAFQEFIWADLVRISQLLVDSIPGLEMTLPAMGDESEGVGPVGVVNEESDDSSTDVDEYFSDTLGSIQASEIVGIVNNAGLSEELQLFAQAFFSYIAAYKNQIKTVGYAYFDNDSLPYQDLGDLPHVEEFDKAVEDNPDICGIPSMEDIEEGSARFSQAVAELEGK